MTAHRNAWFVVAIAAIAAVAFAWLPGAGDAARRGAPPSVHRGNGLRAHASVRVRAAQRSLRRLGYHVRVDGRFGRLTTLAVLRYQSRHGLKSDGVVGRSTRLALQRSVAHVQRVARQARARRLSARRRRRRAAAIAERARRISPPPVAAVPAVPAASIPPPSGLPSRVPPAPVATPAAASAGNSRRGWAVPLSIGVLTLVLFVAAAPMLRESGPGGRGRGRARSAGS